MQMGQIMEEKYEHEFYRDFKEFLIPIIHIFIRHKAPFHTRIIQLFIKLYHHDWCICSVCRYSQILFNTPCTLGHREKDGIHITNPSYCPDFHYCGIHVFIEMIRHALSILRMHVLLWRWSFWTEEEKRKKGRVVKRYTIRYSDRALDGFAEIDPSFARDLTIKESILRIQEEKEERDEIN